MWNEEGLVLLRWWTWFALKEDSLQKSKGKREIVGTVIALTFRYYPNIIARENMRCAAEQNPEIAFASDKSCLAKYNDRIGVRVICDGQM